MNLYDRCVDFDFDNFCICCKAQHFELLLHFELFPIHTTVSRSQFSRCSQKLSVPLQWIQPIVVRLY